MSLSDVECLRALVGEVGRGVLVEVMLGGAEGPVPLEVLGAVAGRAGPFSRLLADCAMAALCEYLSRQLCKDEAALRGALGLLAGTSRFCRSLPEGLAGRLQWQSSVAYKDSAFYCTFRISSLTSTPLMYHSQGPSSPQSA